jgi:hypothetical protein
MGSRGNAVTQAMGELRSAAYDSRTPAEQLRAKVDAVRAARKRALADLEAARKDLVELLTPQQEAILVGLGYLD